MKTQKQPKLLQTDIKHEAILRAAKEVFLTQGFAIASMDKIAEEANVSKKTIYSHFNNKQELFEAMLSEHWNKRLPHNHDLFDKNKSTPDNLKYFSKIFLKFLYQQDTIDLFRLLIGEGNQFPNLAERLVIQKKAPFTRALIEFLKEKQKTGELTFENAERSAAYFMGLLKEYHFWPMMLGFTKQKKITHRNKLIDEAISIFLTAFKAS